ncbi:hypothetical protein [Microbacterium testaceum]|uniref:hypothetical protein n=1 Tax=Microbacterium testaceum TaxID=2033 RepID=UPI0007343145|nr:hypothetical protein [Microbacterium testaceum]KTS03996.1 hypothetical protein NS283_10320 [Microbacterium testaceum]
MQLRPRVRPFTVVAIAVLLIGCSLALTWYSASYWAVCAGADWKHMNPSCLEAMSSYTSARVFDLWAVLTALVAALVILRAVPRLPFGAMAVVAATLACPLFDPGAFWVGWGSADGVPGNGVWTALFLATAGIILLAAPTRASAMSPAPSNETNAETGALTERSV